MNAQRFLGVGCALAAFFSFPLSAPAGEGTVHWNISGGRATITNANGYDRSPAVAPDGSGGLIIAWEDEISLTPGSRRIDLRIQRLDQDGNPLWAATGGGLLRFLDDSVLPALLADGAGGAYIAWWESTTGAVGGPYTLLVHHLGSGGGTYWGTPTAISSPVFGPVHAPQLVPDSTGGALVAFNSRLAHIRSDGTVGAPGVDGIQVGTTSADMIRITSDGGGGAYAAWLENGTNNIRIQRINAGFPWGAAKLVSNRYTGDPVIVSDGSFGAFVAWTGTELPSFVTQVRIQRVNSAGTMLWAADGVDVTDSAFFGGDVSNWFLFTGTPAVASDWAGGAIIAWTDPRSAAPGINDPDAFAQRIDANGVTQWTYGGILLPPYIVGQAAPGTQSGVQIVPDGRGGAVVTCGDRGGWSTDISATRVSHDGVKLFSVWVFSDSYSAGDPGKDQFSPLIVHDPFEASPSGPVIAYIENDPSTEWDIYANKVELSDEPPANDTCYVAETLPVDGVGVRGNTGHATIDDAVAPFCGTSIDGPGVWYRTVGDGTTLTATTCNALTDYDTKLNVYCGSCDDLVCVAGNDDQLGGSDPACSISSVPPGANRASTVSWCSAPGVDYLILVQGYGGAAGPFDLAVTSGAACSTPVACPVPCVGDIDGNGSVGFSDLTQLLNNWGPCGPSCPEDLDEGGAVGFSDLTILLASWGACP